MDPLLQSGEPHSPSPLPSQMAFKPQPTKLPNPTTTSHILHLLRSAPDILSALRIFDSATASGHTHDLHTFSLMVSRLAAANRLRDAESLLSRMQTTLRHPPPEPALFSVLCAYGRGHRPLDALRLFHRIPNPTHRSFTTVFAILVSENHLRLAQNFFKHMRACNVPPTTSSLNVLIKALCACGTVDAAVRVFRGMRPPDAYSYNTLIHGLCNAGRVTEARLIFREMIDHNVATPTVVTYSSFIHGLCRGNCFDEALEVLDEMRKRGVAPNVVTYSSVIDGLCKGGRVLQAMTVMDRMVEERYLPNTITYTAVINGLCNEGRMAEAVEVFDRMRVQGRNPNAVLYSKIVLGLCEADRFREAANYLDEMVLGGVVPNRVTMSLHVRMHNAVVRGLCGGSGLSRAFQVYTSMRTRGISIELETFHLLVVSYCKKGDVKKASHIVDEMLLEGCIPECETWHAIISGYWDWKKTREAAESLSEQLLDEFLDY